MKKMKGKGIATALDYAPPPYAVPEDPRIRFRHQSLLQDYRDLQKETEAMRKKMEILKQRKLTLLAEVQFLRHRYKYFIENQIPKTRESQHDVKPKSSAMKISTMKRKNPGTKLSIQSVPPLGFHANKKQKASNIKRITLPPVNLKRERKINKKDNVAPYSSSPSLDLNQSDPLTSGREVTLLNSQPVYELQQKQMLYRGVEVPMRNPVPIFDLNEISAEELQTGNDQRRVEAVYKISSGAGIKEQDSEINLAVYRSRTNVNGLNKVGKRKISWQDQVALRV